MANIMIMARRGSLDGVEQCLTNNANVNIRDKDLDTPLILAAEQGYNAIVDLLISEGADINLCNRKKQSALILACYEGNFDIARKLITNGADVNVIDKFGNSPLMLCAGQNNLGMIKFLLDHGANPHLKNNKGYSAFSKAYLNNALETIEFLLSINVKINIPKTKAHCPIDKDIIKSMLKSASDADAFCLGFLPDKPPEYIDLFNDRIAYKISTKLFKQKTYDGCPLSEKNTAIIDQIYKIMSYILPLYKIDNINHFLSSLLSQKSLPVSLIGQIIDLLDKTEEDLSIFESEIRAVIEDISPLSPLEFMKLYWQGALDGLAEEKSPSFSEEDTLAYYEANPEDLRSVGSYLNKLHLANTFQTPPEQIDINIMQLLMSIIQKHKSHTFSPHLSSEIIEEISLFNEQCKQYISEYETLGSSAELPI